MKYNLLLILFAVFILFLCGGISTLGANSPDPVELHKIQLLNQEILRLQSLIAQLKLQQQILAGSYLIADISDGTVLSGKNIDQAYPIASITKLMNAVISIENIDTNKDINLKEEMLKPLGYSPSLFLNATVSVKDLLKASLIQSTNDAAESLSYVVGNKIFLDLMNKKTKELGMENTYFYDVHGLSISNRSSAFDLTKLLNYIYKNHPEILTITKDDDFWLPDPTGKLLKFKNLNNFYQLTEFVGGKTGYLPKAKQSLGSVFNVNGKIVAVVLLYSRNRQSDVSSIINFLK